MKTWTQGCWQCRRNTLRRICQFNDLASTIVIVVVCRVLSAIAKCCKQIVALAFFFATELILQGSGAGRLPKNKCLQQLSSSIIVSASSSDLWRTRHATDKYLHVCLKGVSQMLQRTRCEFILLWHTRKDQVVRHCI